MKRTKQSKNSAQKEIAIIGLGKFGRWLIDELQSTNKILIAIDTDRKLVEGIKDKVDVALIGDASDETFLKKAKIDKIDTIIIGIGDNIEASLLIASLLKEWGHQKLICRAINESHERILKLLGVSKVIKPEAEAAKIVAAEIIYPFLFNTEVQINEFEPGFSTVRVKVVNPTFEGRAVKTFQELRGLATISLITRDGKSIIPSGDAILKTNDIVTLVGNTGKLINFVEVLTDPSGTVSK